MLPLSITLSTVPGIPHVHAGDDVAALLLDALGRAGLAPVSYTHLDVYKRQTEYCLLLTAY